MGEDELVKSGQRDPYTSGTPLPHGVLVALGRAVSGHQTCMLSELAGAGADADADATGVALSESSMGPG
jgi:hypothetical protein